MHHSLTKTLLASLMLTCLSSLVGCVETVQMNLDAESTQTPDQLNTYDPVDFNSENPRGPEQDPQNPQDPTFNGPADPTHSGAQEEDPEDPMMEDEDIRGQITPSDAQGFNFQNRPLQEIDRTIESGAQIEWRGSFLNYGRLQVQSFFGNVNVRPSTDDSTVTIRATVSSDRIDVNDVNLVIIEDTWGITVCAVHVGSTNACNIDGSGMQDITDHRNINVDFEISIPPRMHTKVIINQGDISVQNVKRSVMAGTVFGSVNISTEDVVMAGSSQGDVTVRCDPKSFQDYQGRFSNAHGHAAIPTFGEGVSVVSAMGDVTLSIPRETQGYLTGFSGLGEVFTDFTLGESMGYGGLNGFEGVGGFGSIIEGTINQGGDTRIMVGSSMGDVSIHAF